MLAALGLWFSGKPQLRQWAIVTALLGVVGTLVMLWAAGGVAKQTSADASKSANVSLKENATPAGPPPRPPETKLYQNLANGSVGQAPGAYIPGQTFDFVVEHGGVIHTLQVSAKEGDDAAGGKREWGAVDFVVKVENEANDQLLFEKIRTENGAGEAAFTPATPGKYKVTVASTTPGIPKIAVLLYDPEKKNGK